MKKAMGNDCNPEVEIIPEKMCLSRVPAFPPVALKVLDLLAANDVEIRALRDLIAIDAAFSAEVLKLANSPLFGLRAQVKTVHAALVVLGMGRVKNLAVSVATCNYIRAALKVEELRRCWRHTIATAVLSEELAKASGVASEQAYTAGLLHDLGRLGLLVADPAGYADCLRVADRNSLALLDYESKRFGMDHCEAGRLLAKRWGLPEEFQAVAGRHHDPQTGSEMDLLSLVHWACRLADALGFYVVAPLVEQTYEDCTAALPEATRMRLPPHADQMRSMVESRIGYLDGGDSAPVQQAPRVIDAEAPEPVQAPAVWSDVPRRGLMEDLRIVMLTVLLFSLAFLALMFLPRG